MKAGGYVRRLLARWRHRPVANRPLRIDFAWEPVRPWQRLGVIVLGLVVIGDCLILFDYQRRHDAFERWRADWERVSRMSSGLSGSGAADPERMRNELSQALRVIEKLDRSWDTVFNAVEKAATAQATVLAVEPDVELKEVRLTVEAKNPSAMLEYVRSLRDAPILGNAYVLGHQMNMQDPQRPVRFTVNARWDTSPRIGALRREGPNE